MSRGYRNCMCLEATADINYFCHCRSCIGQHCSSIENNAPCFCKGGIGVVGWFLWRVGGHLNDLANLVFSTMFITFYGTCCCHFLTCLRHCCINWIAFLIASLRLTFFSLFFFFNCLQSKSICIPTSKRFCCPLSVLCTYA